MPSISKFVRLFVALALAMIAVPFLASSASAAPGDKIVVCKWVTTPGGSEHHIVVVAEDTLPAEWDGSTLPFSWVDAHGKTFEGSVAIRLADPGPPPEQAQDISLDECPDAPPPPDDVCPELDGDQAFPFQCEPETATENRDLEPLLDCDAGTITTIHQERSRTQTFNADTQEWVWGEWSDWTDVGEPTVENATSEDCPVDNPPEPIVDPPANPTLPNTGSSPYLTALALMGGLILTAGSALFMRSRKVRVPKA